MTAPQPAARVDFMSQFGVEWLDPTADRKLLERLLTFPLHIFRVGNRPRGLARELGRGRLPDSVRLRRARGAHFPEQTAWFAQAADDYRKAFQTLRESPICAAFLDLASLEPLLTKLCAGGGSAAQALTVHRALDAGLFAAAFESGQSLASCQDLESARHAGRGPGFHELADIPTLRVFGTGEVDSTRRARA
jgi:asparagine synthase (glutamine-hydrolysing)